MSVTLDPRQATEGGELRYAYKPSLMGQPCEFALKPDGLEYRVGRQSGRVRYDAVRRVRMSFRPATTQPNRFVTEIRSIGHPKLQIVSVSWRSMMEQERLDGPYVAFVTELHRRLAAAGTAQFSAGLPLIPYWIGVVVFAGMIFVAGTIVVRAMQTGQWSGAAILGVFCAVCIAQLGNFIRRNWPLAYRPDAIPRGVLPRT
jgi:hypothetical protein